MAAKAPLVVKVWHLVSALTDRNRPKSVGNLNGKPNAKADFPIEVLAFG
ncbi:MAG: hypothetical protein ACLQJL_13700 [Roseiarcus sp.]